LIMLFCCVDFFVFLCYPFLAISLFYTTAILLTLKLEWRFRMDPNSYSNSLVRKIAFEKDDMSKFGSPTWHADMKKMLTVSETVLVVTDFQSSDHLTSEVFPRLIKEYGVRILFVNLAELNFNKKSSDKFVNDRPFQSLLDALPLVDSLLYLSVNPCYHQALVKEYLEENLTGRTLSKFQYLFVNCYGLPLVDEDNIPAIDGDVVIDSSFFDNYPEPIFGSDRSAEGEEIVLILE